MANVAIRDNKTARTNHLFLNKPTLKEGYLIDLAENAWNNSNITMIKNTTVCALTKSCPVKCIHMKNPKAVAIISRG